MTRSFAALVLLVLAGCRHAPEEKKVPVSELQKTGEVLYAGRSAAFTADRVWGPAMDISRRSDGTWAGQLHQEAIDVNVYNGRIAGVHLSFSYEQTADTLLAQGLFLGRPFRVRIGPTQIEVMVHSRALQLDRHDTQSFGPTGELRIWHEPANAPLPVFQVVLALLGTFETPAGVMQPTNGVRWGPPPEPKPGQ
jgi:hypothetical protein